MGAEAVSNVGDTVTINLAPADQQVHTAAKIDDVLTLVFAFLLGFFGGRASK